VYRHCTYLLIHARRIIALLFEPTASTDDYNVNKIRHALFDKTDISHLVCYCYISEHTAFVGSFRVMIFINYRNLIILVNVVFEKNIILCPEAYNGHIYQHQSVTERLKHQI
jgi:hypothetical protein